MSAALVSIVYDSGFGHTRKTVAKDVVRVSGVTAQMSAAGEDIPWQVPAKSHAIISDSARTSPAPLSMGTPQ